MSGCISAPHPLREFRAPADSIDVFLGVGAKWKVKTELYKQFLQGKHTQVPRQVNSVGLPGRVLEHFSGGPWTTLMSSPALHHDSSSGTHKILIARTLLPWVNLCKKLTLLLKSHWSLPLWPPNALSSMLHLSLLIRFEPRWPLYDIQLNFISWIILIQNYP